MAVAYRSNARHVLYVGLEPFQTTFQTGERRTGDASSFLHLSLVGVATIGTDHFLVVLQSTTDGSRLGITFHRANNDDPSHNGRLQTVLSTVHEYALQKKCFVKPMIRPDIADSFSLEHAIAQ